MRLSATRHSELDSFVAATLHKQLESFKLPRGVLRNKIREMRQPEAGEQQSKELTKEVKTRIHRCFGIKRNFRWRQIWRIRLGKRYKIQNI